MTRYITARHADRPCVWIKLERLNQYFYCGCRDFAAEDCGEFLRWQTWSFIQGVADVGPGDFRDLCFAWSANQLRLRSAGVNGVYTGNAQQQQQQQQQK